MTQSVQIQGKTFIMHYSGALFWQERSALIISDVHLGKISHFRKFGAAVPQKAVTQNFLVMNEVIDFFKPKTIIFLGDLFHSSVNKEWNYFEEWVKLIQTKIILVSGNHDIISPLKYEDLGVQVIGELVWDGFLLTHHPEEREKLFSFSGHVHPAIRLHGIGRQFVRLRCFFKTKNQMILPAFGEFTGNFTMKATPDCEAYALLGDSVLQVPLKETKRKGRF